MSVFCPTEPSHADLSFHEVASAAAERLNLIIGEGDACRMVDGGSIDVDKTDRGSAANRRDAFGGAVERATDFYDRVRESRTVILPGPDPGHLVVARGRAWALARVG